MIEKGDIVPVFLLSASTFLIVGGANILNDLGDLTIDAGRGRNRPIASREMSEKFARRYFVSLWIIAIFLTMTTSFMLKASLPLFIILSSILLLYGYERLFKERGLPGNIIIGLLTGAPFLLGASISGVSMIISWIFLMAVLANISRELTKDIEDAEMDRSKRTTLPMRIGRRNSACISAALMVSAVLVSFVPVIVHGLDPLYIIPVGLADIVFLLSLAGIFKDSRKAQEMAKLGMICAVLGFILWSIG